MSDVQQLVQEAIDQSVESGAERGIQVAVYRDGQPLVDAVAGVAEPATGRPVTPDTPFYNFSIVKAAASTIAHMLAERGLFGYDTPVVDLWPEFGAHGKGAVTVGTSSTIRPACPAYRSTQPRRICATGTRCARRSPMPSCGGAGNQGRVSRVHLRLHRR